MGAILGHISSVLGGARNPSAVPRTEEELLVTSGDEYLSARPAPGTLGKTSVNCLTVNLNSGSFEL